MAEGTTEYPHRRKEVLSELRRERQSRHILTKRGNEYEEIEKDRILGSSVWDLIWLIY
jgi:hypothetical protein